VIDEARLQHFLQRITEIRADRTPSIIKIDV
jgi:hypothetical protein